MADPRVEKLADILVNHSVEVQKGDRVLIMGSSEAAPLIREVYRKVLRQGARPETQISIPGLSRIWADEAGEEQLKDIEVMEWLIKHVDAFINIPASSNTKEMTGVDSQKMQLAQEAFQPVQKYVMSGKVRGVVTEFPTNAAAQDAEMPLEAYEDFVYGATNIDYAEMKESMDEASEHFNKAKKVRIVAEGTDVTVDIEGREAIVANGKRNVPDGEFFFTPNHLKTEGTIYYDWPAVYGGREVQGIRLTFKEGKIVEFSAEKGQDFLEKTLNMDEGSRYLGELGIGTNFGITKPTKSVLFDEKIGGSIHMAVGAAYEEPGNQSAIHWDMVKNLKNGGEIYLDGKLVQKDGKWVF
ncbi:MAG TPA: aminopeptidase [Bacillales bacterium]|nr:aminopeptidase [Bacillales bacterium]